MDQMKKIFNTMAFDLEHSLVPNQNPSASDIQKEITQSHCYFRASTTVLLDATKFDFPVVSTTTKPAPNQDPSLSDSQVASYEHRSVVKPWVLIPVKLSVFPNIISPCRPSRIPVYVPAPVCIEYRLKFDWIEMSSLIQAKFYRLHICSSEDKDRKEISTHLSNYDKLDS